jgi:hypothetical protein
LIDSQSIIHTLPKDSTPLKHSKGQSYGTTPTADPAAVDVNDDDDDDSSSTSSTDNSRPETPPPVVCKGVMITSESTKNKRKLIFVTVLCLCFFGVEMVGGYFAKSLALMSDAFHLLSGKLLSTFFFSQNKIEQFHFFFSSISLFSLLPLSSLSSNGQRVPL